MTLITENDEEIPAELVFEQVAHDDPPEVAIERRLSARFDRNFVTIENTIVALRREFEKLRARPPKPPKVRRSGAAARTNPDRLWFGLLIAGLNAVFILGAFVLSFAGQYAFAPNTVVAPGFYWWIPLALDLPIVVSAFTAAVFRRRKQHARANINWIFVGALTVFSSGIQATHVLEGHGFFAGAELTFPQWLGVVVMASMPWLVLYLSENLAGLLVKPTGETRDPATVTPVRRKPTTRTRSKK